MVHEAEQVGTYHSSYHRYAQYAGFLRLWSVTSMVGAVAATVVVYSALQFLFPLQLTSPALAVSQTVTVTSTADSGAGTLRDAIRQANLASAGTETIIDFTVSGEITLASTLDINRQVTFQVDAGDVTVNGANVTRCFNVGSGADNSEISDIIITNCQQAINIANVGGSISGVSVHDVDITGSTTAIHIEGNADSITLTENKIIGGGDYISVEGDGVAEDLTIRDNAIGDTDTAGSNCIALWGTVNATVDGNTITNCNGMGVDLDNASGTLITGNTMDNAGVDVGGTSPNTIIGGDTEDERNLINNNTSANGVFVQEEATSTQIIGNYIGLDATGMQDYGNATSGIVDGGTDTLIENNFVAGGDDSGIGVNGTGTIVRGNTLGFAIDGKTAIPNGDSDIILNGNVSTASNITIDDNLIGNNTNNAAIEAYQTNGLTITNNRVVSTVHGGFSLNSVQNVTITDNIIGTNADGDTGLGVDPWAIDIMNEDNVAAHNITISENTFAEVDEVGVSVDDGQKVVTITKNNFSSGSGIYIDNESNGITVPTIEVATSTDGIAGTGGAEGGRVEVYEDGGYIGDASSIDASGTWSVATGELSTTPDDGSSITALSIDVNGNTSEFSAALSYTGEKDSDDDEGDDESSGDVSDGDDAVDDDTPLTEEEEQNITFSYLQPASKVVVVNGETVVAGEAVIVNQGKTTITVHNVPAKHRVQLRVEEKDAGSKQKVTVKKTTYKKPTAGGVVKGSFTADDTTKKYRVFGTGQTKDKQDTSKERILAKVNVTTLEQPRIETIDGDFLVTTSLRRVLFEGDSNSGRVRIYYGGVFLGGCDPTPCRVPFEGKGYGEYIVKYDTITDNDTSPVDERRVFIADRTPTSVFNVDPRQFSPNRITSSNTVKVVGVGPGGDNVAGEIEINGETTAVDYTSEVGFEAEVDLSEVTYGDHTLVVHFYDVDPQDDAWSERMRDRIVFEFKKWPSPAALLIEKVPQSVVRNMPLELTVTGGAGNRVQVMSDDEVVYSVDLEQIADTAQGSAVISFDTSTIGSADYTVYAEDRFGIRTPEVRVAYDVVASPPVIAPEAETDSATTDDTDAADETSGSSTDAGTTDDTPEAESPITPAPSSEDTSDNTPAAQPPVPTPVDTDGDGLTNDEELTLGTNPVVEDSDADTIPDTEEVIIGTDPVAADDATQISDAIRFRILPVRPDWVPGDVTLTNPRVHIIDDVLDRIPGLKDVEVDPSFWSTPLPALMPQKDTESVKKLKAKLDDSNTAKHLEVVPMIITKDSVTKEEVDRAVASPNEAGAIVLNNTRIIGIPANKYTKFIEPTIQETQIVYRGTTIANAMVIIEINSDPVVRVTRADANGEWSITVPVEAIPAGEHTATVYSQYQGAESGRAQIAKFVVLEDEHLSNTSWLLLVNIILVITLLGVMVTLQLRHRPIAAP